MKQIVMLFLAMAIAVTQLATADVDTQTDANDVILAGHDAVAYQTMNKALVGSPEFTAEYNGAIYRFVSASNRDTFKANPAKYAPMYGGYCAYGMTFGKKFTVDGKAFQIVDGKLYVNKNIEVYNTWKKDIPGNIKKANAQWPQVKDIAPSKL